MRTLTIQPNQMMLTVSLQLSVILIANKNIDSLEDSRETEILISISTFGRANYQTTTLSIEPYHLTMANYQSPVIHTSTNSVGSVLLRIPDK